MKCIKKFFKKKTAQVTSKVTKLKLGMIIPHTIKAQGAVAYDGKLSEYNYGLLLAYTLDIRTASRNIGGVHKAAKKLVDYGCNASIEPHFNAYNGKAYGAEILVLANDPESEIFARKVIELFVKKFPERKMRADYGIKKVFQGDRGYNNLKAAKSEGIRVAILTELFFGDNEKDWMEIYTHADFIREIQRELKC